MKHQSVLIASHSMADAELARELLRQTCNQITISANAVNHLADFANFLPDVLVLAFRNLADAKLYHQALREAKQLSHSFRTVLLCQKDELKAAYDLCRQEDFDDYVLFWPMSFDSTRLSMSVLRAMRSIETLRKVQSMPQASPAPKSKPVPKAKADSVLAQIKRERPLVMLIDDEIFQHNLVRHLLSGVECDFLFAFSGTEAVSKLQYVKPNLILMDISMPGMNGVDLTRHLKSTPNREDIPIIMVTGNSDKDMVRQSLEAGAADFLVKPFSQDMFLKKLQRFLR